MEEIDGSHSTLVLKVGMKYCSLELAQELHVMYSLPSNAYAPSFACLKR